MALNNNAVYSIISEIYNQSTGESAVANVGTLSDFIDKGNSLSGTAYTDFLNDLTSSLMVKFVADIYTQKEYVGRFPSPWYVSNEEYGAILQAITIETPEVHENSAMSALESGVTTAGTWTVYLPTVNSTVFTKSSSWGLPITISEKQYNNAFSSEGEFVSFVNFIFVAVRTGIAKHIENMDSMNRNNFMLERVYNGDNKGVINTVQMYYDETGDTSVVDGTTVSTALCFKTPAFWLFFSEKFRLACDYIKGLSTMFTVETERFIAPEDMVVQINSTIAEKFNTYAMSDTYHNEIIELKSNGGAFNRVPYWQGSGTSMTDSWDNVSKIDATISIDGTETECTLSGVACLITDRRAIMHTIVSRRVGHMRDDIKALDGYEYQFIDRYVNLVDMPACIMLCADGTTE